MLQGRGLDRPRAHVPDPPLPHAVFLSVNLALRRVAMAASREELSQSTGSSSRTVLPLGNIWQRLETFWIVTTCHWPGLLLNILHFEAQSP